MVPELCWQNDRAAELFGYFLVVTSGSKIWLELNFFVVDVEQEFALQVVNDLSNILHIFHIWWVHYLLLIFYNFTVFLPLILLFPVAFLQC
jgi:hypothetical protein